MAALAGSLKRFVHHAADDGHLLSAFRRERDESAFAEIVRRHGPFVIGVCSRALGNPHDAEDAAQAVFLVLARKAQTITRPECLAGWLHTVAGRAAREVRSMRERHRKADRARPAGEAINTPIIDSSLASLLDDELARLPEQYRLPVICCELQGQSRADAARVLGIPEGTLSSRLAEAKKRLARRLKQRGITAGLSAWLATSATDGFASAQVARLAAAAIAGNATTLSSTALAAADVVVKSLLASKLKNMAIATLVLAIIGGGLTVKPSVRPVHAAEPALPAALVRQLGSSRFKDRENASRKLRELARAAFPTVRAGINDPNPEIARRCIALEAEIRGDLMNELARTFEAKGNADYDHPVWQRYKKLAGNTPTSRTLFAEMIADPRRATMLDDSEADPARQAELYRREAARQSFNARYNIAKQLPGGYHLLEGGPDERQVKPSPDRITDGTLATLFMLGSYSTTAVSVTGKDYADRPVQEAMILGTDAFWALGGNSLNPQRQPLRKLFAAWVAQRVDSDPIESSYWRACNERMAELVPVARRHLDDKTIPSPARAYAALLLARCGDHRDLSRIAALLDDRTIARPVIYDQKRSPVQVRDAALAASLLLIGANPVDFGFEVLGKRSTPKEDAYDLAWLGFWNAEVREATHLKGREFLFKQPRIEQPTSKRADFWTRFIADFRAGKDVSHPAWTRFRGLVGGDNASRLLFREMTADADRAKAVEACGSEPETAGQLYATEIARQKSKRDRQFCDMMLHTAMPTRVGKVDWASIRGDWALVLFLGSFPESAKAVVDAKAEIDAIEYIAFPPGELVPPPMRKLVHAWGITRGHPRSIKYALECGLNFDIPELLSFARRSVADESLPIAVRASGLPLLGQFGDEKDVATLATFLDNKLLFIRRELGKQPMAEKPGDQAPAEPALVVQVRDVAAVMILKRFGKKPDEFGFRYGLVTPTAYVNNKYYTILQGFPETPDGETARDAAHGKLRSLLNR